MLDEELNTGTTAAENAAEAPPAKKPARKRTTKKAAAPAVEAPVESAEGAPAAEPGGEAPADAPVAKKPARKRAAKKATAPSAEAPAATPDAAPETAPDAVPSTTEAADTQAPPAEAPVAKRAPRKRTSKKTAAAAEPAVEPTAEGGDTAAATSEQEAPAGSEAAAPAGPAVLFQAPVVTTTTRRTRKKAAAKAPVAEPEAPAEETEDEEAAAVQGAEQTEQAAESAQEQVPAEETDAAETSTDETSTDETSTDETSTDETSTDEDGEDGTPARRRRRRGGRRRRKSGENGSDDSGSADDSADTAEATGATEPAAESGEGSGEAGAEDQGEAAGEGTSRRRRRRRRAGEDGGSSDFEDANTVTRVRQARSAEDQITAVSGSTRLEAKKQRRREGREAGRRRAPIVSEAEFLARRESVERVMVIRQRDDLTQIAVLEDKVLVEHYVARESQTSLIGNIYLGRVQNVLPSMEAAFIDIGKGRNAVLYAGEVNWSALGHKEGQPRKIESVLQSGQTVLVQVTKDPVGHKGARLTSQISLAGRFLVYVPDGTTSGISRKLPDTERNRLKTLLKEIVPDTAGVIVRTAAEGASEEELTRDVERLKARWEDIEKKASGKGGGAQLLYGEPDLTLKVVRDLFTEDFTKLVIEGAEAWDTVHGYVSHVAPDLAERIERFEPAAEGKHAGKDVFATYRIEEQIQKGLDRKVWLPSGGSLIIDRTEAMTVVDVNTGKFTGSGGNLEETVTKNNLEAAEEIVRQLRLRDIGGIIVVDFIDMVLESNRDLVVRRLVECLGRDRTRHQVAEVTSLGLVQMTRKRIGTGLLEAFSENCEHCHGRGVVIKDSPVDSSKSDDDGSRRSSGRRSRRGRNGQDATTPAPSPADVAAMARHEKSDDEAPEDAGEQAPAEQAPVEEAPVQDAPAAQAPVAGTPVAPAPQEEAPVEEAPVEEAPAEEAPQEEAPAEEAPVEEAPEEAAPAEAAAPVVVTRTRRRAASRPAGPPPAVEVPPVELPEQPVVSEDAPAPVVTHVPIKKRGTRKR